MREGGCSGPSSSSSDDRWEEKQVPDQACSSYRATDRREFSDLTSLSSSEESLLMGSRGMAKRRRRKLPSTTPSLSEVEMLSDNGKEERCKTGKLEIPPPSRASKRLPLVEERLVAIRHTPTAILAENILEGADSIEYVAATSGNLKGTYVRRLRDDGGKIRANTIELAKRTDTTAAMAALE